MLEGSVRREGNRVRITAQLIEALTGRHVFSERYDRELKEIFATQDDIAIKVLTALRVALTDGEIARLQGRGVSNIEAYFKLLQAHTLTQAMNKESSARARRLAEETLLIEPGSSRAYFILASTHFIDFWVGPPKSAAESIAQGIAMAKKTIEMDPYTAAAYSLLGMVNVTKGEYDKAVEVAEKGASMDPSSVTAVYLYGSTLMHATRHIEAIPVLEKAIRLGPLNPPLQCLSNLANCYSVVGRYDEAVKLLKRVLQEQPNQYLANLTLTSVYARISFPGTHTTREYTAQPTATSTVANFVIPQQTGRRLIRSYLKPTWTRGVEAWIIGHLLGRTIRMCDHKIPMTGRSKTIGFLLLCLTVSGCTPDESPLKGENEALKKQVSKQESLLTSLQDGNKVMQQQIDLLNQELRDAKQSTESAKASTSRLSELLDDQLAQTKRMTAEIQRTAAAQAAQEVKVDDKGAQVDTLHRPLGTVVKVVEEALARNGYQLKVGIKTEQKAVYITERKISTPASLEVAGFRNQYLVSLHALPANLTKLAVKAEFENPGVNAR